MFYYSLENRQTMAMRDERTQQKKKWQQISRSPGCRFSIVDFGVVMCLRREKLFLSPFVQG